MPGADGVPDLLPAGLKLVLMRVEPSAQWAQAALVVAVVSSSQLDDEKNDGRVAGWRPVPPPVGPDFRH